jgi:hypothetical protein
VASGEWRVASGEWRVVSGDRSTEAEKKEDVGCCCLNLLHTIMKLKCGVTNHF